MTGSSLRINMLVTAICAMSLISVAAVATDGPIASPEPDWPQWRGRLRNGISDETGLGQRWPAEGPKQIWKIDGLGTGWSSPVLVGERLYITGDFEDGLYLLAYDLNGKLLWRAKNGSAWTGSYPGSRSSCTFSQGRLYHLNAHGRLACFDAATGQEVWAIDVLQRFGSPNITWGLSESVLVDGTHVIATPGGPKALMAAFDARDGHTVWATETLAGDATSYSSPILIQHGGRRLLINCSASHGFGVDADGGRLMWSVPLKNQYFVNASSPVFAAGRVFFVTPYGEEGRAYRLDATAAGIDAQQAWKNSLDTVTGGAVVVGDTLFAAGYRKSKWWLAVDFATGQVRSELKELTTGAAIYADKRLYCLDEQGNVGLVSADDGRLELAGRFSLGLERARDAWAHPVLLRGRLYLRYHDSLWCFDVRQPN